VTISADDGDQAEGTFRFGVGASTILPPLPASGPVPTLTIAHTTVNGHEVRMDVDVEGATLGMPTGGDMEMSAGGMGGDMDHDAMDGGSGMPMTAGALPQGHLHVYVDGVMLQMVYQPNIVLTDVPSGSHQIRVELSNNAHQDWDPPVMATTSVMVP
jgi:hypothetical protein